MKTRLMFTDFWEEAEVQFYRETELEFVPAVGMQFNFKPDPFELFVDAVRWYHDEGELVISFDCPGHESKQEFIKAVRTVIACNKWKYRANKKAAEIIDVILRGNMKEVAGSR